jgi:signal transduction histidine kinase
VPVLDEGGEISEWVGAASDISARKQAEAERLKNYQVLRQAEEVAHLGSREYDHPTGALIWSEGLYRLFGLPQGSPVRVEMYLDFVVAEDRPRTQKMINQLSAGEDPLDETLRVRVNGQVHTLRIKSYILRNGQGAAVKTLGVDLDISELKRLESENLNMRMAQQQQLLNAILQAQEEERRRISESLHNGVGQLLYATKLNLSQVEMSFESGRVQRVEEGLRATEALLTEAINQTRRASHELVPVLLKEFGLGAAIADFCSRFSGKGIALSCHGIEERLPDHLEMAVYRIAQELVNNIVKHAGATRARIEVSKDRDTVWIEAQDNGKGMEGTHFEKGIGLKTIADRVKLLDGKIEVESAPGKGTLVTILLPLSRKGNPQ